MIKEFHMNINFENYIYNGAWYGTEKVEFNGQNFDVDVQIDGYDESIIPESGKSVFLNFLHKLNGYTAKIAEAVFQYYCVRREELGYSYEFNADYPAISKSEKILKMITLIGITVPDQDDYDEATVSLVFNCTWDKENGVGICFIGEDIDDIGFQDIAM